MELQQEPKEYPSHTRRWCCANTRFLIGQGNGWRHFTRYGNYSGMRERGMRTRIESIYVLTTVSVKKNIFLNEEIVDRKIAGLGVQMFSTVLCTTSLSSNLQKQTLAATLYFTACVSWGYPQGGDGGRNCQALEERRCGSQDPVCKCAVQGLSFD